ncbi:hypothetical protein NDU88_006029 [Pleurodeles waltl]|uniref:Uncharacterized protein n=1 Tax=Pleurodeles waltl TaxID=8319 RepID=A0AAV7MEM4_PLEWA|nr:hypothetical protein NDU88_006029 [Pleurodeles waltl]
MSTSSSRSRAAVWPYSSIPVPCTLPSLSRRAESQVGLSLHGPEPREVFICCRGRLVLRLREEQKPASVTLTTADPNQRQR